MVSQKELQNLIHRFIRDIENLQSIVKKRLFNGHFKRNVIDVVN